jgi:hypothetical protein
MIAPGYSGPSFVSDGINVDLMFPQSHARGMGNPYAAIEGEPEILVGCLMRHQTKGAHLTAREVAQFHSVLRRNLAAASYGFAIFLHQPGRQIGTANQVPRVLQKAKVAQDRVVALAIPAKEIAARALDAAGAVLGIIEIAQSVLGDRIGGAASSCRCRLAAIRRHLGNAFGSGFRSARPVDPTDVVVALVVWTSVVLPPQPCGS